MCAYVDFVQILWDLDMRFLAWRCNLYSPVVLLCMFETICALSLYLTLSLLLLLSLSLALLLLLSLTLSK